MAIQFRIFLFLPLLFSFSTDTLYLSQLAATAVKDLQVTLELLDIAKDEQERLGKIHSDIRSKQMLARRIERRMNYIQSLSDTEINSHGEFNMALRRLRFEIDQSERILSDIERRYAVSKSFKEHSEINLSYAESLEDEAEEILSRTYSETSTEEASLNTAMSSAFSASMLSKIYSSNERSNEALAQAMSDWYEQMYISSERQSAYDRWTGNNQMRAFWARERGDEF